MYSNEEVGRQNEKSVLEIGTWMEQNEPSVLWCGGYTRSIINKRNNNY